MTKKEILLRSTIFSVLITVVGTLFKIMHWPDSRVILFFGYVLLFLIYPRYALYEVGERIFKVLKISGILLFAGFKTLIILYPDYRSVFVLFSSFGILLFLVISLYQYTGLEIFKTSKREKMIAILFLLGISILAISVFFKIIHWPFAGPIMIFGLIIVVISFLATVFIKDEVE